MSVEYQFTNPTKWQQISNQTYAAQGVVGVLERYHPIPNQTISIQPSSGYLAVFCANSQAPDHWRYGGRYFIKLRTGLIVDQNLPDTVIKVGKLYLNQVEIIQVPNYSLSYSFTIDIPYWHRELNVIVWEYVGDNRNTIHRKLDDLLGYPQP